MTGPHLVTGPIVPATLDGWSLLHQAFRVRWPALRALSSSVRSSLASEVARALEVPATDGLTGFVQLLGHKGDLLLIHARRDFDALSQAQLHVATSSLFEYLEPTFSYVSIVELGMYEMTAKLHGELAGRGLEAGTDAFAQALAEAMADQAKRVSSRLFLELPRRRHVCFYPMNKRRGEVKNWYSAPFEERAGMMREHGHIGRKYAGKVTQIISGSIGFDDWEWGVDLFADDPAIFKQLIYEMRFDRASADYAEFGDFAVGVQFDRAELSVLLEGRTPALIAAPDATAQR
ncbi:MAG: hydrogen peroxide-dependent heme synthase [Vicinamibacteraceae bacterium]